MSPGFLQEERLRSDSQDLRVKPYNNWAVLNDGHGDGSWPEALNSSCDGDTGQSRAHRTLWCEEEAESGRQEPECRSQSGTRVRAKSLLGH